MQIPSADGVVLHGWYFPPSGRTRDAAPRGTIVQFHGNAGNVTSHFLSLAWVTRHGWSLLAFDYRGYGRSSRVGPTPAGLRQDALAAIAWARRRAPAGTLEPDLVLYGQSLGGAVLLDAFTEIEDRARIRAVVVEGSFHSYEEVAASVMFRHVLLFPLTGLGYALVSDAHAPARSVARVSPIPLLIIHDARDPVVDIDFGVALYDLASQPKTFWVPDRGSHTAATADPDVQQALLAWVERQRSPSP